MMPPKNEIIPPEEGWSENTLYLVEVSYSGSNPVHQAYLRVGFLNDDGKPGSYTKLWNASYDLPLRLFFAYYLRVIKTLHKEDA